MAMQVGLVNLIRGCYRPTVGTADDTYGLLECRSFPDVKPESLRKDTVANQLAGEVSWTVPSKGVGK